MQKRLKFNIKDRNLWVTADSHYQHQRDFIIKPRGFECPEKHSEWLIANWNEKILPNDIVIHLGDVSLNSSKENTEDFFRQLNGEIYLIFGNHESFTRKIYQEQIKKQFNLEYQEIYPLTWENVTFCGNMLTCFVANQMIVCTHFPMRIWDGMGDGAWNLSGHSHGNDKERNIEDVGQGKCLDCGVDNFLGPVKFTEIAKIMNARAKKLVDHHGN